ncbi:MAG: hypothetical protein ABIY70_23020 [Capsulimonas sp.]|uniref:hypothetical protein n=1 Tax=Capsulimonas sp. TaxID=2494211 RepID=UPI0032641765
MMSRIRMSALPALILALLPILLLWRVVFLGEAFVPADLQRDIAPWRNAADTHLPPWNPLMWDGVAEFYPWRFFLSRSIHEGYLPLWNPHQFCGTPFVGNSQSAIFYPFNTLFVVLPVTAAFGVSVLLHLFLTGVFLYAFLRSSPLGLSRSAALAGAVVWQLCTWQVSWLALPTFLCVSTWLPLALLLTQRLADRPTPLRATMLGASLGLMLLAGHLQICLYCYLLVGAYALCIALPSARGRSRKALLGSAGLAAGIMLLIGAAQLLPSVELSRMSHRIGGTPTWEGYQGYTKLAVPAYHLASIFAPDFFGNPTVGSYWGYTNYAENAAYVGVPALLLALVGLIAGWRPSKPIRFFGVCAALSLLIATGTPVDAVLFFGIPGFAQTGSPGRILVLWSFCAAILAAYGAQAVIGQLRETKPAALLAKAGGALLALLVIVTGYTFWWIGKNAPAGAISTILATEGDLWRLPVGLLFAAGILLYLARGAKMTPRMAGGGLVVILALDLLLAGIGYNRSTVPANVYPTTPLIAFLQQHAGTDRIMPVNSSWSIDPTHPPRAILPPNAAIVYGLYDTQGYDSLFPGQYMAFAAAINGDGKPPSPQENGNMVFTRGFGTELSRMASARYLVSREPLPTSDTAITSVYTGADGYVYEDKSAAPRTSVNDGPNRLILTAANDSPQGVVVNDQWFPGWRARRSRTAAMVAHGPQVFQTVSGVREVIRRGEQIEMRYAPSSVQVGMYALCMACALLAFTISQATTKQKRAARP